MKILSAEEVRAALPYDRLVAELPALLRQEVTAPPRPVFDMPGGAALLLMPAWSKSLGGVKMVHVTPENAARGKEVVTASYLVFDGETHEHLAVIDGGELTARRTAAVAAIAADRLATTSAQSLLIIGSGRIASELAFAYRAVRSINRVRVFSPTTAHAQSLVDRLSAAGFTSRVCLDPQADINGADIIACATLSRTPLIKGEWLSGGQHLALIGGFTPTMREADDAALRRCAVHVDTLTACAEAGDLAQPIASGDLRPEDICADLIGLCDPAFVPAQGPTLFKSVGEARQDLAAATVLLGHANKT